MKAGEVRKRFREIWGPFMKSEGFVYKGGGYYKHEPENGIVQAVEVDNIFNGHGRRVWFNVMSYMDIEVAPYALLMYELEQCMEIIKGEAPGKSLYSKTVYEFELDNEADQGLRRRLEDFKTYIYPYMKEVHDISTLTKFTIYFSLEIFNIYNRRNDNDGLSIPMRCLQIWRSLKIHEEVLLKKCVEQQRNYVEVLRNDIKERYPTEELEQEDATDQEKAYYRQRRRRLIKYVDQWDEWLQIIDAGDREKIERIIDEKMKVGKNACQVFFGRRKR